jgi:hypothetical protein
LVQAQLARMQALMGLLRALGGGCKAIEWKQYYAGRQANRSRRMRFYSLALRKDMTMRVFLVSLTAVVVIAVAAAVVLDTFQTPASDAFSTSAVRL